MFLTIKFKYCNLYIHAKINIKNTFQMANEYEQGYTDGFIDGMIDGCRRKENFTTKDLVLLLGFSTIAVYKFCKRAISRFSSN